MRYDGDIRCRGDVLGLGANGPEFAKTIYTGFGELVLNQAVTKCNIESCLPTAGIPRNGHTKD